MKWVLGTSTANTIRYCDNLDSDRRVGSVRRASIAVGSRNEASCVEITAHNWPRLRAKILGIERVSFVQSIRDSPRSLAALAQSSSSIFLAMKVDRAPNTIGYLAADMLEKFAAIPSLLCDPYFEAGNTIYIASVAILAGWRHRGFAIALQKECLRGALARGLTRATAHIESGALSRMRLEGRVLGQFRELV